MSLADHLESLNLARGRVSRETALLGQVVAEAEALLDEYERACLAVGSKSSEAATRLRRLLTDLDIVRTR